MARSRLRLSAPDPAPASITRAPGKMSAPTTICAASLGYTTAAPRGIVVVNSASSGRNARNSVPPVVRTTRPSGRPISSSWSITPREGWNLPPSASTIECRRPLASVSVIRSPARRSPRRTPDRSGVPPAPGAAGPPYSAEVSSAIAHPPQSELPAGAEGQLVDVHPDPDEQELVGLADRQHGQVGRRTGLQLPDQRLGLVLVRGRP